MNNLSRSYPGTREYYDSRTLPETEARQNSLKKIETLRKSLSRKVDSEIMAQMPDNIRAEIANEEAVNANPRAFRFLSRSEYSLSEGVARVEHVLSRPFRRGGQLLVDISTDPVYQLLSEIIDAIPEVIAERWDELNRVSFPTTEAIMRYEFESTVDVVLSKAQKWQDTLVSRGDLSKLGENGDNLSVEAVYFSLLRATELSPDKRIEFIKGLIGAIPQWMGGKIYWHSIDDICSEVLSPKTEPKSVGRELILRDEDIPF